TFTGVNDTLVEGTETATLTISNPSAGITLGSTVSQNIAITDNDLKNYALATILKTRGTYDNKNTLADITDDTINYGLRLQVRSTDNTGQSITPSALAGYVVPGLSGTNILVSDAIPFGTELAVVPTAPTGWAVVYSTTPVTTSANAAIWTTTAPALSTVTRIGFAKGTVDGSTSTYLAAADAQSTQFSIQLKVRTGQVAPLTIANIAQVFGKTPETNALVLDESGDINPSNFDGTLNNMTPPATTDTNGDGVPDKLPDVVSNGYLGDPKTDPSVLNNVGTDINGDNTGSGPSGEANVFVISNSASILNGPSNSANAVGPTNNNDDFTNKSSNVLAGLTPGSTFNPNPVTFTNTVLNTGSLSANISLLPTPPATPSHLPSGTVATIFYGAASATYRYNGTSFTFTGGTGVVGGNPIGANNPLRIDAVAANNGTANYGVEIDLPAGTPLSTDLNIQRGFPVPITAFIDANGNGSADDAIKNSTINRVYTGFLQQVTRSRILQGTGPVVQGADGTLSTDPKTPAPGNIVEYAVQYNNISEIQTGIGNVTLSADRVVITEDGIVNNWAKDNDNNGVIDTSHVLSSDQGAATIIYFSGNPANNLLGGEQSGTTVNSDVTKYINTVIGQVSSGISRTFIFQRQVNQTTAGQLITNTANATYEDPNNPGSVINNTSNPINVTIPELAGITVTSDGWVDPNGGVVAAGDLLIFSFIVTNIGNDPTRFRIPNLATTTGPATVSGTLPGGTPNSLQYSTDNGLNWANVPDGGLDTASVPVNGTIRVRVPVTVQAGAQNGDIITVKLGNINPDAQNVPRSPDGGDVYTVDNPDGTPGEVSGAPANGPREASATQSVTVQIIETTVVNDSGNLVITDAVNTNDNLRISSNGIVLTITDTNGKLIGTAISGATGNGTSTVTIPLSSFTGNIQTNTLGGDDTLTVDFTGGANPIPTGGLTFNGGTQATSPNGDKLALTGSNFTNTTYTYINENDGSINLDGKVITYTGLEPIASTVNATNVILDYSTAAETITVTSANATQTTVDSTAGEITTFNNPTSSLTISGGATGANTFNLNSISSGFAGDLILNGSGYTNGDVVNLNANPASNDFTIDLVQNINVATGIALTTIDNPDNGDINWKAGQTINFASGSSLTTTNGLINLAAQGNLTGANYIGVNVNNAAIASVNGNITVTGTGGGISANGINLYTSNINASNSTITMTGIGTGNGISAFRSSITGNDNASLDGNGSSGYGVFLSSSPVQSSNGTVTIKGIGFDGIYANNSNITGYSNVSLDGNGSSGYGVFLSSSPVQSSNGTVTIKGIGRDGISASSNSNITGNDNVSLDGNGSSGYGVNLSTSLVQSSNGTVTIKGIGFDGISASSNSNITGYDNVSLDGNGRSSYGVFLSSSPVQSSNGTVTIKGIGFDGIYANNSNITGYS
ncbi:MAG: beta strand repeat-containing protein, partial [Pseudanabaenaceae cyanobacterium]